jgi:hypothetical protein
MYRLVTVSFITYGPTGHIHGARERRTSVVRVCHEFAHVQVSLWHDLVPYPARIRL